MLFRPKQPTVPHELSARFGEPEYAFGPNMRFRVVSAICGVALISMALLYALISIGPNPVPLAGGVSHMLTFGLIVLGGFCIIAPRLVPANWVFVCPSGVIRARGANWSAVGWDEVARFEDATRNSGSTTIHQCRLVLNEGGEWGFLADWIGDYRTLAELLSRKVDEFKRNQPPGAAANN